MSQLAFRYQAIDSIGKATRGVMRAPSREEAYRRIVAGGLQPVRITSQRGAHGGRGKITA